MPTNNERAARLAELGFFHIESRMAQSLAAGDGVLDGDILLSLLTELPKRGLWWQLETMPDDGGFRADICDGKDEYVNGRCVGAQVYAAGHPTDPLIALVDAVIAAHAERQTT